MSEEITGVVSDAVADSAAAVDESSKDTVLGSSTPKAEEAAKPEGDVQTADADAKPKEGAPEKYEWKAPEGMPLDTAALEQFEPFARELNLTNENAQKLMDLHVSRLNALQQSQAEAWHKTIEGWGESFMKDKEIGGAAKDVSVKDARAAVEKFGTPELMAILNMPSKDNPNGLGLGNHPELIRAFSRIGKLLRESGEHIPSSRPSGAGTDLAHRMYPANK